MPMMTMAQASIPPRRTPTKISKGEAAYFIVADKDNGKLAKAARKARS
jgi:hypothetical protein